jgi:hypothetical protein
MRSGSNKLGAALRSSSDLRLEGERFGKRFGAALNEIIEIRRRM